MRTDFADISASEDDRDSDRHITFLFNFVFITITSLCLFELM
jgi:hypothetical protein